MGMIGKSQALRALRTTGVLAATGLLAAACSSGGSSSSTTTTAAGGSSSGTLDNSLALAYTGGTAGNERLGIPQIKCLDGPRGVGFFYKTKKGADTAAAKLKQLKLKPHIEYREDF